MSVTSEAIEKTVRAIKQAPFGWLDAFRHYFYFGGRTNQLGFWSFAIINSLILFILFIIDELFSLQYYVFFQNINTVISLLFTIYLLISLIPSCALCVRRLHDLNLRGWWFLLVILPIPYFHYVFISKLAFFVVASQKSSSKERFGKIITENFTR